MTHDEGKLEEGLSYLPEGEWAVAESKKRDNAENGKDDYKTDKGNINKKYKHLVWCKLKYIFFSFM